MDTPEQCLKLCRRAAADGTVGYSSVGYSFYSL